MTKSDSDDDVDTRQAAAFFGITEQPIRGWCMAHRFRWRPTPRSAWRIPRRQNDRAGHLEVLIRAGAPREQITLYGRVERRPRDWPALSVRFLRVIHRTARGRRR